MKKRIMAGAGASALIAVAALVILVTGAIAGSGATPLPASSCSAIQNGSGKYLIASDLPLQGSGRAQTIQMTQAIAFELQQHGWKAGNYTLAYQSCDDSTAQAGKWDSGKASANASAYANDPSVDRRYRHLQLGCGRDRDPDPQPCSERPARHGQPGEHVRRPDPHRPGNLRG